jgi:membrane fusion protein (multidrug efflux system)
MRLLKMDTKRAQTVCAGLAIAALTTLCAAGATSGPAEVQTVKLKQGVIFRMVTLPGEIKAAQQATLYAKVTGYLKSIAVDKGDEVKEGSLIAEIEVPELLADAAKQKAEMELAAVD